VTRAYVDIIYTPNVLASQDEWDTRAQTEPAFRSDIEAHDELSSLAQAFVAHVNTAFISTVGSNGWPYVQHRGGPRGFIRVIDSKQLLFPNIDGNGQLVTVGNLRGDTRTMLILIDYSTRRRLKLWGHATVLRKSDDSKTIDWGDAPRAILFTVAAMNFNCPTGIPHIDDSEFL
jgi:uncharacterized protein